MCRCLDVLIEATGDHGACDVAAAGGPRKSRQQPDSRTTTGRTLRSRADRTLALDPLDSGGQVSADARLVLPPPRALARAFVLQPWLAVAHDAVVPGRGSVADLRAAATDEVVRR